MLARRPYSVAELRRALSRKFNDEAAISAAVARLRELKFLDDRKFAEQYSSSLVRNRALGRARVRRELKSKLVDYRHIEPALDQAFEETTERELLERVLERKIRALRLPLTLAKFYSLCQSLARRGFRSDDIMKAVRARPELKPVANKIDSDEL